MLQKYMPLFEAADKGGGGGGEQPAPDPQQSGDKGGAEAPKGDENLLNQFAGNESGADLLKNAPVIDPNTGEPVDQQPKQGEKSAETGKETPQQTNGKAQESEKVDESTHRVEEPVKYKLGDQEYTAEQVQSWKSAFDEKKHWEGNLTQRSQADGFIRNLPEEVQGRYLARVLADSYAKKDVKEYLEDVQEKPIEIDYEDADGENQTHSIDPGTDGYKELYDHFEKIFLKKYEPAFVDWKQHKDQQEQFNKDQERLYKEANQKSAIEVLKKYPEIGIPVKDGMDLEKTLQDAINAGPTHPLHDNALKFYSLASAANSIGMSLDKYVDQLYSGFKEKKSEAQKIAEADKANQKEGTPETPGLGPKQGPKDFIDAMKEHKGTTSDDLYAEFDKGKK